MEDDIGNKNHILTVTATEGDDDSDFDAIGTNTGAEKKPPSFDEEEPVIFRKDVNKPLDEVELDLELPRHNTSSVDPIDERENAVVNTGSSGTSKTETPPVDNNQNVYATYSQPTSLSTGLPTDSQRDIVVPVPSEEKVPSGSGNYYAVPQREQGVNSIPSEQERKKSEPTKHNSNNSSKDIPEYTVPGGFPEGGTPPAGGVYAPKSGQNATTTSNHQSSSAEHRSFLKENVGDEPKINNNNIATTGPKKEDLPKNNTPILNQQNPFSGSADTTTTTNNNNTIPPPSSGGSATTQPLQNESTLKTAGKNDNKPSDAALQAAQLSDSEHKPPSSSQVNTQQNTVKQGASNVKSSIEQVNNTEPNTVKQEVGNAKSSIEQGNTEPSTAKQEASNVKSSIEQQKEAPTLRDSTNHPSSGRPSQDGVSSNKGSNSKGSRNIFKKIAKAFK